MNRRTIQRRVRANRYLASTAQHAKQRSLRRNCCLRREMIQLGSGLLSEAPVVARFNRQRALSYCRSAFRLGIQPLRNAIRDVQPKQTGRS